MDEYQEAEHDQHPREVRVLAGHSDIIRIVARVDDKRYVSMVITIAVMEDIL